MFSIYTGLAFGDAMTLTPSHFHKLEDGTVKLSKKRGKTGVLTESILITQATAIIDAFKPLPEIQHFNRILPLMYNADFNQQLKTIASLAGIPFYLTHHIARHTYRQLLNEAEISDVATIKRMMGHSNMGDIDATYNMVTEKNLKAAGAKFQSYINETLGK
jgi:integrase